MGSIGSDFLATERIQCALDVAVAEPPALRVRAIAGRENDMRPRGWWRCLREVTLNRKAEPTWALHGHALNRALCERNRRDGGDAKGEQEACAHAEA